MKRRKTLQKARGSVKSSDSDSEKVSRAHNPTPHNDKEENAEKNKRKGL